MQIFILGMHRSGTSAVARLLNMMGAYFSPEGYELAAREENIKGFWERTDIMELNDAILSASNSSWSNPVPFSLKKINKKQFKLLSTQASSILLKLDAHRPWMIKDPRLSIVYPFWARQLEFPTCVFVYRNPIQIAQSLSKRNQFPIHFGIALWEYYTISALNSLKKQKTIFIHYSRLMEDPLSVVKILHDKLKISGIDQLRLPTDKEITSFLDPHLFHEKDGEDLFESYLNQNQRELVDFLQHSQDTIGINNFSISQMSIEIIETFAHLFEHKKDNIKLSETLQHIKKDNFSLNSSVDAQNIELQKFITSLKTSKNNIKTISSELSNLDKENKNLQLTLGSTQQAFSNLNTEFREAKKGNEKTNITLQQTQQDYSTLESQFHVARKENERINIALQQTQKDYSSLQNQFHEATKERDRINIALRQTQKDYSSLQNQFDEATKERDRINIALRQTQKDYSTLETQVHEAEKENDRVNIVLQQTQKDYSTIDNQLKNSEKESAKIMEEKNALIVSLEKILIKEKSLIEICSLMGSQIKMLQSDNKIYGDYISQLESWLSELNSDINGIFSSWRWKTGNFLMRIAETILFRFKTKTAKDHIQNILSEFDQRDANRLKEFDKVKHRKDSHINFEAFCKLLIAALKNPTQTLSLTSINRLKNLYITLFKQSPHEQQNIFDYYLALYNHQAPQINHNNSIKHHDQKTTIIFPIYESPVVSIIIPVFNNYEITMACLLSIAVAEDIVPFEVIIGDDNSTDRTLKIEDDVRNLTVIRHSENIGFLNNCNATAKHAKGKFILFLNNDTTVTSGWLDSLVEIVKKSSKVGIVGSKLLFPDGKLQEAGGIIWNDGSGWNYGRGDDPTKSEYNYLKEVDYLSGACFLTPKKLWEKLRGFDTQYSPAYYEDTDYSFTVRKHGYKVLYQPLSQVVHHEGMSCGTDLNKGIKKYQQTNKEKFLLKWRSILENEHSANGLDVFTARDRSQRKKTILVIDHYVPQFDRDAGSRSTYQYLQWFVESGFNVKFMGDNFHQDEPYTTALQQIGVEVLFGSWYATNWKKWIKENKNHLDYIYLHRPHIAPHYLDYIKNETQAKIIYFGHDLHYLRLLRQYEVEKDESLKKAAEEWKKKEFDIFKKVDVIYYPSEIETNEISKVFPEKTIRPIPLYIFDKIDLLPSTFEDRTNILFVGGFRHQPNVDAIEWFVNNIFHGIQAKIPNITLFIAGSNMPADIKKLESGQIKILGEISDKKLESLYHTTKISIVPLRYGAGVKGKILEALHFQIPVVTTDIGAEGFPEAQKYLRISNEPSKFAQHVCEVYSNESLWVTQVKNGVTALNTYFSKERAKSIWEKDIDFGKKS